MKNLRTLLSACAAVLLGLIVVAEASADQTIDILPLGDSITAYGQYIPYLKTALAIEGYQCVEIANEGYGGYAILHQYTFDGTTYTGTAPGLLEVLPTALADPRVNSSNTDILLEIGTNDVNTGFRLEDADVQYRMSLLIPSIENMAPQAHLIVAETIPNCVSTALNTEEQQMNVDIAASVATASQTWSNISLINQYPAFNPTLYSPYTSTPSPYMMDGLHPNQYGGIVMATVWNQGILAVEAAEGAQVAETPEPSSLALLAAGGLTLAACAGVAAGDEWVKLPNPPIRGDKPHGSLAPAPGLLLPRPRRMGILPLLILPQEWARLRRQRLI